MIKSKKRIYLWYKVRELRQQFLSLSQISRELGLNRATVRRYLEINEDEFHKRIEQGRNLPKKLSKYLDYIKGELQRQPFLSAAPLAAALLCLAAARLHRVALLITDI